MMLRLQSDAVLDFQSVPANNAMWAIACHVIGSHLCESPDFQVVVIETFNKFPTHLLKRHPNYETGWLHRMKRYNLTSFAQVLSFFMFNPLGHVTAGSVMVFVCNFHELVELYKLQLSAAYEEALLKHQIDKNRVLLSNFDRFSEEGVGSIGLPELPAQSALLKENPILKAQNHLNEMFKHISEFSFNHSLVVVLMGHLDVKYKQYTKRKIHPTMDSSFASQSFLSSPTTSFGSDGGRMVLIPMTFGKSTSRGGVSLNDSKVTARLVFYNDWYHKSPLGQSESSTDPRLVSVVKVSSLNGLGNINDPVFFEFNTEASAPGDAQLESWFIDLQDQEQEDLSTIIQHSLSSTQQQPKRNVVRARPITLPSSPTASRTQFSQHLTQLAQFADEDGQTQASVYSDVLVIDGSDVELTGTLLEDLEDFEAES